MARFNLYSQMMSRHNQNVMYEEENEEEEIKDFNDRDERDDSDLKSASKEEAAN